MAVVRVAWIATLGAVADALVAPLVVVVVVVAVPPAALAADGRRARERHVTNSSGSRPRVAVEGSTGHRNGRTGEHVAFEVSVRHRRGRVDPPRHVARLRAAGQHHGEAGPGERARRNLDQPGRVGAASERQYARLRLGADAVHTGSKLDTRERPCDDWTVVARLGRECR